eukprot:129538_1
MSAPVNTELEESTNTSLKRKHSETDANNDSNTETKCENSPSPKKSKIIGDINTTNGNTDYGLTKGQQKKQERYGFTQQERNKYKRQQKKENKQLKNKLKLESMSEEEKTKYFDEKMQKRKLKQQQKEFYNKKLLQASKTGMKICIDLYFNKYYNKNMEYTNVIKQLCYCWNANKLSLNPISLHLLNVDQNWNKYFESQGILQWKGINI